MAIHHTKTDFPELSEVDLNPVLARKDGATAVDARFVVSFDPPADRPARYSDEEIFPSVTGPVGRSGARSVSMRLSAAWIRGSKPLAASQVCEVASGFTCSNPCTCTAIWR